jgi:subtilisin family serine protease
MKVSRLSASLAALIDEYRNQGPHALLAAPRTVPLSSGPGGTAPVVSVFVRCRANTDLGTVAGVRAYQPAGKIRTARVPLDRLEDLADKAGVTRVSAARKLRPLDVAAAAVHLPAYRAADPTGRTGKGVLVGVVDTGIDTTHPAFAGRILSLWDQEMAGTGWGTTNYGNVLTGAAMAASLDVHGHGSHVAGIAAGAHTAFGGVAPEADLIIVKTNFENTGIADGVRYIFDQADQLGRPAVANLSLGGHWDAHDGTDDLSAALDALTGTGRIVVAAAGNEGGDPSHAAVTVPANGEAEVQFRTVPSSDDDAPPWVVLNGWYPGARELEVSVRTSAGDVTPFQPVIANALPVKNHSFTTARLRVTTPPATVNPNDDHHFLVEVYPGPFNTRVQGGTWRLRLRNPGSAAARVDVWSIVDAVSAPAAFRPPAVSDELKVGSPGAAASVITAASYTTRNQWVDSGGSSRAVGLVLNDVSEFSSPGPLRTGEQKPDLAAPGAMIISCRSAAADPRPANVVAPRFMVEAGTSMASPFVAGLVALLLQQKPTMTPAQVRNKLRSAAAIPNQPAGTFDPKWGFGLIDAAQL